MTPEFIEHTADFLELCDHIRECGLVAFDTEFVSDIGYRPELGLLQFATRHRCAAVDPLAVSSLGPWWNLMADDQTTVVVHGGQAEIRFCIQRSGRIPQKLVDIQLAEGLRGRSYPLAYTAIVERVLGRTVSSNQTRSDWLRRPLSRDQLRYALDDVSHILEIWDRQSAWLKTRRRDSWADAEFSRMCQDIYDDEQIPSWERISGAHRLSRRDLAVLQRLADWREQTAAELNKPARRILRDDLLLDLAKRRPANIQQALATRDLNRPEYRRRLPEMVDVIAEVLRLPEEKLPPRLRPRDDSAADDQIISRLLALALGNVCAELEIAQSLVGTSRDLTELVRAVRSGETGEPPLLLRGWRGEICGDLLRKVLDGRICFRVAPENSATPLLFEEVPERKGR
ncbi:MAG: Ribonuclease [Planctomycetota bacterium]